MGIPYGIPVGIPYGIPVGIPVGIPYGIPLGIPYGIPVGIPYGIPVGIPIAPSGRCGKARSARLIVKKFCPCGHFSVRATVGQEISVGLEKLRDDEIDSRPVLLISGPDQQVKTAWIGWERPG